MRGGRVLQPMMIVAGPVADGLKSVAAPNAKARVVALRHAAAVKNYSLINISYTAAGISYFGGKVLYSL